MRRCRESAYLPEFSHYRRKKNMSGFMLPILVQSIRRCLLVLTTVTLGFNVSLAADPIYVRTFNNKNATGDELVRAFFDLLSHTGSPTGTIGTTREQDDASRALVKPYLDPAFLLQRATGERYLAENYLPADVDTFKIGGVSETRPIDGVRAVRYSVSVMETFPDSALLMSKDKAPRLTVFHWSEKDLRWKILSHANFNTPVSAICNQKPLVDNKIKSPASPEDQALGERLIGRFYELINQGDALPVLHPEIQFQSASGVGYARLPNRPAPSKYDELTFSNTIVTRNGRLMVVATYNVTKERTLMQNNPLRAGEAPNLSTFLQDDNGRWSLISVSSFAAAKALPSGTQCIPPGKLENAP